MSLRREWLRRSCVALIAGVIASAAMSTPIQEQGAPVAGAHSAGRASDTGYLGEVNSPGAFGATVPLDLPGARGGLPVPVEIVYGDNRIGAAGRLRNSCLAGLKIDRHPRSWRYPYTAPSALP